MSASLYIARHRYCFLFLRFSVDKLEDIKSFGVDLIFGFCVDGECTNTKLLDSLIIPSPFCNPNISFTLPGRGSIADFVDLISDQISDEAIQAVLRTLGIEVRYIH